MNVRAMVGCYRSAAVSGPFAMVLAVVFISGTMSVPMAPRSYAVIFDAGSTGTRVHVFSWEHASREVGGLPDVRAEPGGNKKVMPGISSFDSSPEEAGASILPLLELAEKIVPPVEHAHTMVLLRATAGMRLLTRRRAQRIYNSLYETVSRRGTFRPNHRDFGTLSGDDEGVREQRPPNRRDSAPLSLRCPPIAVPATTARHDHPALLSPASARSLTSSTSHTLLTHLIRAHADLWMAMRQLPAQTRGADRYDGQRGRARSRRRLDTD